jgi:hypothetical protein
MFLPRNFPRDVSNPSCLFQNVAVSSATDFHISLSLDIAFLLGFMMG